MLTPCKKAQNRIWPWQRPKQKIAMTTTTVFRTQPLSVVIQKWLKCNFQMMQSAARFLCDGRASSIQSSEWWEAGEILELPSALIVRYSLTVYGFISYHIVMIFCGKLSKPAKYAWRRRLAAVCHAHSTQSTESSGNDWCAARPAHDGVPKHGRHERGENHVNAMSQ